MVTPCAADFCRRLRDILWQIDPHQPAINKVRQPEDMWEELFALFKWGGHVPAHHGAAMYLAGMCNAIGIFLNLLHGGFIHGAPFRLVHDSLDPDIYEKSWQASRAWMKLNSISLADEKWPPSAPGACFQRRALCESTLAGPHTRIGFFPSLSTRYYLWFTKTFLAPRRSPQQVTVRRSSAA